MSNGDWLIFVSRPIAGTLMVAAAIMLAMSALSMASKRRDWRAQMAEEVKE
jgi:TctA family transporter